MGQTSLHKLGESPTNKCTGGLGPSPTWGSAPVTAHHPCHHPLSDWGSVSQGLGEHAPWTGGARFMDWGSTSHELGEHISRTGGALLMNWGSYDLAKISLTRTLSPLPTQPQIVRRGHTRPPLLRPGRPPGGHSPPRAPRPSPIDQQSPGTHVHRFVKLTTTF